MVFSEVPGPGGLDIHVKCYKPAAVLYHVRGYALCATDSPDTNLATYTK